MWHAKVTGGYAKESTEAIENCTEIYGILKLKGWTHNAICACLGNINHEGQYNPWRWEADNVPTYDQWYDEWKDSYSHGYGMWGFTPSSKYILSDYARATYGYRPNFLDQEGNATDGRAQTYFMDSGLSGWIERERFNYMTFDEYKVSNESLYYLTRVFLYCFENPANPEASLSDRYAAAQYWDNYFTNVDPDVPDPEPSPDPEPDPPEPEPSVRVRDRRRWKFWLFF